MSRNSSAAGIDVYTTVNIQHVESLNDVVAQITRIRVRETVPDSIIDRADDIEVIDLTPGDLIQRLKQGKVYLPATAKSAIENYFAPGNLTALRELALRRTAQRVDEQLVGHMRAACDRRARGRPATACSGLHRRAAALAGAHPLGEAACGTPARAVDGGDRRNTRSARFPRRSATGSRCRCALARRSARRRRPCRPSASPRSDRAMRASTTSPTSSSDDRTSRAGGNAGGIRDPRADPPGRRHQRARHLRAEKDPAAPKGRCIERADGEFAVAALPGEPGDRRGGARAAAFCCSSFSMSPISASCS